MLHNDVATKWGSTRSAMASFRDEKVKKKEQEGENVEEEESYTENNGIKVFIVLPVVKTTSLSSLMTKFPSTLMR